MSLVFARDVVKGHFPLSIPLANDIGIWKMNVHGSLLPFKRPLPREFWRIFQFI